MSINLGIYDFFSYVIPGLLYLFSLNELSRSVGWEHIDVIPWIMSGQSPSILLGFSILICAYITGHLFDRVALKFYEIIFKIRKSSEGTNWYIASIKDRYPQLNIQFTPKDRTLLFTLIRQRNAEMAKVLDGFSANNIMLRNIALGLFVLFVANIVIFISTRVIDSLFLAITILVLCMLSISGSVQYRKWFIKDVFRASLEYGATVEEVVNFNKKKRQEGKRRSRLPK